MDPNRAKVSLGKHIKPYIHGQTEYMIRTSKRSPVVVVHWLVWIFDSVAVVLPSNIRVWLFLEYKKEVPLLMLLPLRLA